MWWLIVACGFDTGVVQESRAAPAADTPPTGAQAAVATPLVAKPSAQAPLEDEQNTIDVFEAAGPATVFVTQTRVVRDLFSARALEVPAGSGSGFLWDAEGHVVTNYHVIQGAQSLEVTLDGDHTLPAKVVGAEPRKDIAVLKIEAPADLRLVPVRLPPEGYALRVGQKTLAIGNPFGLDHTLTVGIVSALGREVPGVGGVSIRDMIQTDASINPGNSGGPLLDSQGQLIGMNTSIYSKSGSSAGIGFAVPVDTIRRIVPQLIATGRAERVGLGISVVDDSIARRAGIEGVVIEGVAPGSPAERVGLSGLRSSGRQTTVGDVIVQIGGEEIEDYDDLYNALDGRKAGEVVEVTVRREGKLVPVEVELTSLAN